MITKGNTPLKQIIPAATHFFVAVDVANGDALWNSVTRDMKTGMSMPSLFPPLSCPLPFLIIF
jgi:hypothetical protein